MKRQSTLKACLQFALLALLLCVETRRPRYHYHRYLLSDYKPQHSPRVYWDYVRHTPKLPKAEEGSPEISVRFKADNTKKPRSPIVLLNGLYQKFNIKNLIVGVFDDGNFICLGTLITDKIAITSHGCFKHKPSGVVAIHTHDGSRHVVSLAEAGETNDIGGDMSHLQVLVLDEPIDHPNMKVELCERMLKANDNVFIPTYTDNRFKIDILNTTVKSQDDCMELFQDQRKKLLTPATVCVNNPVPSNGCKKSSGEPLIYDGRICGINIGGHNCPDAVEADIFVLVYSQKALMKK